MGIVELVRRRKLNEEYSFLWLSIGAILLVVAIFPELLLWISDFIGTELPINALFFTALIFLMLLGVFYSLKMSVLSNRVKKLSQKIALLEFEIKNNKSADELNKSSIKEEDDSKK